MSPHAHAALRPRPPPGLLLDRPPQNPTLPTRARCRLPRRPRHRLAQRRPPPHFPPLATGPHPIHLRAPPHASPEFIAARAKGRLDHALRKNGWPHGFARSVSLRSLGENTLDVVLQYIATQLDRADLADPRYVQSLAQAAWTDGDLDLAEPLSGSHGRYWYNLHLVAVTDRRWRVGREDFLPKIPAAVRAWSDALSTEGRAGEHRPGVYSLAVMPDHVHLSVPGPSARSPDEIAGSWREALNRAAGCRLFDPRVYAGTFSTYPLSHIRSR